MLVQEVFLILNKWRVCMSVWDGVKHNILGENTWIGLFTCPVVKLVAAFPFLGDLKLDSIRNNPELEDRSLRWMGPRCCSYRALVACLFKVY